MNTFEVKHLGVHTAGGRNSGRNRTLFAFFKITEANVLWNWKTVKKALETLRTNNMDTSIAIGGDGTVVYLKSAGNYVAHKEGK